MGLFGGAATTTTKVRPSRQVEDILKNVVNETQNMPQGEFQNYNLAGLNDTQRGALASLAGSSELNNVASMFGGRTQQGLNQLNQASQYLRNLANNGVSLQDVQNYAQQMTGNSSLAKRALAQGTSAGGAAKAIGGGAALRSANRRSIGQINAIAQNQLGQQALAQGIEQEFGNKAAQANITNQIAGQGTSNLGLGASGVAAANQAIQNQLQAGNIEQQQQQQQNQVDWQNKMGAQQYDWNQINNKLNVLNEVSPMAGYTTTGVGGGISKSQQLLGAGMTGLGIAGKLGAFNSASNLAGQFGGADSAKGGAVANGDGLWQAAQQNGRSLGGGSNITSAALNSGPTWYGQALSGINSFLGGGR